MMALEEELAAHGDREGGERDERVHVRQRMPVVRTLGMPVVRLIELPHTIGPAMETTNASYLYAPLGRPQALRRRLLRERP